HAAAEMAVRVLNGEKPEDIPVVVSNHAYMFDWRALKRWGMKVSDLPPGSVVLHRELSFWEIYRRYFVASVILVFAQALIIFALLRQRAKRRKTEAELVRSNEQLRLAMEHGKTVGWDLDVKTSRVAWFGDLPTMFGIKSETFAGDIEEFYRYVYPADRKRISDAVAEARLENSERKFSSVFHQSPLAIAITRLQDHRYVEVNETYEHLTGWRHDEVIGRSPLDISLWVDPVQRKEFVKRLLAEGAARNVEVRVRRKDGQIRTTLGSSEIIGCNGEPCVLSVFSDVTDLNQAEDAERASEHRFRQFFDTLPEYCFMTSADGEILDANPAACKALGYLREELIGKSLSTIYALGSVTNMVD